MTPVCLHNAALDTLDWTWMKLGHFQPEVQKQMGGAVAYKTNVWESKVLFLILRRIITEFIYIYI